MVEKALHAGNLAAAFAVIATTADLTLAGGAATTIGGLLSTTEIWKQTDRQLRKDAKAIAADLDTTMAQTHLTSGQIRLLRQMLANYPPEDSEFPTADMNGGKLTELLIKRISATAVDDAHKTPNALDAYRRVMPSVLQDAIARTIATNETQSAMLAHLVEQVNASAKSDALRKLGITEDAIIGLAQRIVVDVDDVGQAWTELENAIEIAVRVQAEGAVQSNHGDFVDTVLARVADLAKDGQFTTASAEIDDALDQADAQIARLLDSGVEVALLDRETAKAAALLIRKADLAAGGQANFETLRATRHHHYNIGRDKGSNLDSKLAIDLAQAILLRAQSPDQRGTAGNDLGIALQTLGARESSTDRLDQSVTAYAEPLKENTHDRVPMQWARTQMNLGSVLAILGSLESGTERLDQAVTAYTEALKERTRDRVPMQWAMTQGNLSKLAVAFFDKTNDPAQLDIAYDHAMASREVYVAGKADHYVNWIDEQHLAAIQTRRDAI